MGAARVKAEERQENWRTMSLTFVRDRLVRYGVPEDKARRLDKYAAPRLYRVLEERNELLACCSIESLVADMKRAGVQLVQADGGWKLKPVGVVAERWLEGVLPTLRNRRDEIVAGWETPPVAETCAKCLALVCDPESAGHGCRFILSCPYHSYRGIADEINRVRQPAAE